MHIYTYMLIYVYIYTYHIYIYIIIYHIKYLKNDTCFLVFMMAFICFYFQVCESC